LRITKYIVFIVYYIYIKGYNKDSIMNLQKILAENMLRFAPKNLDKASISNILTIIEQAGISGLPKTYEEFIALDSADVTKTPGYVELFKRVFELQSGKGTGYNNSEQYATETIGWWSGSPQLNNQQNRAKDQTDNVIKNIDFMISSLESIKSGKFNIQISDLDKRLMLLKQVRAQLNSLMSKDIYINNWRPQGVDQTGKIYNLSTKVYGDIDRLSSTVPAPSDLQKFLTNIDAESAPGKQIYSKQTYSSKIPDTDKVKLISQAIQKARNANKPLSNADRIYIGPKNTAVLYSKQEQTTPPAPMAFPIAYPPKNPNSPLIQNFFGDDKYQVSSEQQAGFASTLQQAVQYCKSQGTILEVQYKAGSSTSKVPTRFAGGNAGLTDERLKSIDTVLASTIANNPDLKGIKVTKLDPERKVEVGPVYDRATYSPDKRKANPETQKKYDALYGPHRGSYGEFVIIYQPQPEEPSSNTEYTPIGNWAIKIDWHEIRIPKISIPKIGVMQPKQRRAKNFSTTDCWAG